MISMEKDLFKKIDFGYGSVNPKLWGTNLKKKKRKENE